MALHTCSYLHILFGDVPNVDSPPPLKADVLHRLSRKKVLRIAPTKEFVLQAKRGRREREGEDVRVAGERQTAKKLQKGLQVEANETSLLENSVTVHDLTVSLHLH